MTGDYQYDRSLLCSHNTVRSLTVTRHKETRPSPTRLNQLKTSPQSQITMAPVSILARLRGMYSGKMGMSMSQHA